MRKVTKHPSAKREVRKYISIPDFDVVQHPKRPKKPTWLKTYTTALNSPEYIAMSYAARGVLGDLIKLAGTCQNRIPDDMSFLARRLGGYPANLGRIVARLVADRWLTRFTEDLEVSKNRELDEKIASHGNPPSSSTSQSKSPSVDRLNLTTRDGPEIAPDSDDADAYYEQLAELDADREAGGSHD